MILSIFSILFFVYFYVMRNICIPNFQFDWFLFLVTETWAKNKISSQNRNVYFLFKNQKWSQGKRRKFEIQSFFHKKFNLIFFIKKKKKSSQKSSECFVVHLFFFWKSFFHVKFYNLMIHKKCTLKFEIFLFGKRKEIEEKNRQ